MNRQISVSCDEHDRSVTEKVYLVTGGADTTVTCPADDSGPSEWDYDRDNFYCAVGELLNYFLVCIYQFYVYVYGLVKAIGG